MHKWQTPNSEMNAITRWLLRKTVIVLAEVALKAVQ